MQIQFPHFSTSSWFVFPSALRFSADKAKIRQYVFSFFFFPRLITVTQLVMLHFIRLCQFWNLHALIWNVHVQSTEWYQFWVFAGSIRAMSNSNPGLADCYQRSPSLKPPCAVQGSLKRALLVSQRPKELRASASSSSNASPNCPWSSSEYSRIRRAKIAFFHPQNDGFRLQAQLQGQVRQFYESDRFGQLCLWQFFSVRAVVCLHQNAEVYYQLSLEWRHYLQAVFG